jgi:peptidoglycan/LPS O-acetylase OafA/YrhL
MLDFLKIRDINKHRRNVGLDIVRAIAIFLVLFSHGRPLMPNFPGKELLSNGGYFGVELFFVLSGFLIGSILLKLFNEMQQANLKMDLVLDFWIRRWFRTLPNYFLFLILNLTLFQWLFVPKQLDIKYFFFLQNFLWTCPSLMPESWSLAIEEWFYISFPLVMTVFIQVPIRRRMSTTNLKKTALEGLIVYLLIFTIFRFIAAFSEGSLWDAGIRKIVVYRLDACGFGVLIAYLNFYHCQWLSRNRKRMLFWGCILTTLSISLFSYATLTTRETVLNKSLLFTLTTMGLALPLPWFKELRVENKTITYLISHISIVSYSMYLIHFSFTVPFLIHYLPMDLPWPIVYCLYILLTVFLSTFVYKYFEKPTTILRDRFTRRETNMAQQLVAPATVPLRSIVAGGCIKI